MKYGIKIAIQNDDSSKARFLWHLGNEGICPLLFNFKEDAEAYLGDGKENFRKKIPIYCRDWETQTIEVQEFYG